MMQLYVLGTIFMITGLFLIFKVDPVDFINVLTKPLQKRRAKKDRIDRLVGKTPPKLRQMINNSKEMLESSNKGADIRRYQLCSLLLAVAGFLIGTAIDNIMAAFVLVFGMSITPIFYIQVKTGTYIRYLNDSIETTLSVVTNAYIQSGDLIDAVKSSIKAIPAPMDDIFRKFLVEVELIDSSVVQALQNMSNRVDRRHFKEWCSVACQSQSDRELRYAMPDIVERLSDYRQVQMEMDTALRRVYTDYVTLVVIILASIPMMALFMPVWFNALTQTVVGKITLAVVLLVIFLCTITVVRKNKPLDAD